MHLSSGNSVNKERSKSSSGILTSQSSHHQQQPPHMIAEFPDYYVRANDDIIRPKPRRLVDMRRSAVGPGMELSLSSDASPSNANVNAPMLPARPFPNSAYTQKPLPPKPSNTNVQLQAANQQPFLAQMQALSPTSKHQQQFQQLCMVNPDNYLQYPPPFSNGSQPPMVTGVHRKEHPGSGPGPPASSGVPSFISTHIIHSSTATPNGGNVMLNMNQRSVPSLPQLLQNERQTHHQQQQHQMLRMRQSFSPPPKHITEQQKGFLSPQPGMANHQQQQQQGYLANRSDPRPHGGSASNLHSPNSNGNGGPNKFYNNNIDDGTNGPYYCDLIPKTTNQQHQQQQQNQNLPPQHRPLVNANASNPNPKVRPVVEWKSVDNLQLVQQHLQVANNSNSNNTPISTQVQPQDPERSGRIFQNSSVVKNLSLAFEMNSNSKMGRRTGNEYEIPKPVRLNRRNETAQEHEYDRIRSPPTVSGNPKQDPSSELCKQHHAFGPALSPATAALNNKNQLEEPKRVSTISDSTDASSVGRSSASDYDFSSSVGSASTVKASVTQLEQHGPQSEPPPNDPTGNNRKGKNTSASTPSSKLKSKSRRNILQHLSMEELQELKNSANILPLGPPAGTTIVPEKTANNTGTGGSSSSDGSSGHASMTDSQTSGSPPAPAEYGKTGDRDRDGDALHLSSSSYKSVLKSVPEDENPSSVSVGCVNNQKNETPVNMNSSSNSGGGSRGGGGGGSSNSSGGGGGHRKSSSSSKSRHRNNKAHAAQDSILLGNGNNGLEDIKQAIEQLTLKSSTGTTSILDKSQNRFLSSGADHHSSYSTSTYSSMSGSECDRRRGGGKSTNHHNSSGNSHHNTSGNLLRHSSLETINTQVTTADEFVWVDSHNRLVELQQFPWSNVDILKVIEKSSRLRDNLERISMESVPRVSYLLQRALVRIAREVQRLSKMIGFCSKHEISSAFRIVLAPGLADSCNKACLRAAAMYSVSTTDPLHRQSKSGRAGLHLHVGRFQRWMVEVRLGRFVHEFAAIHFTAGIENLIEEIFVQAIGFISSSETLDNQFNIHLKNLNTQQPTNGPNQRILTAALLEQAISFNADLWGLLQPFAHLNAGRMASGALAIPRWSSVASVDSAGSSCTTIGGTHDDLSHRLHQHNKSLEQSLLTTCVGSTGELNDLLAKVTTYHHKKVPHTTANGTKSLPPCWSPSAVHALFYFMRCSQLEAADELANLNASTATLRSDNVDKVAQNMSNRPPVQELVYERPFIVLPPLIEWVRVATAHADYRHASVIDKDDVLQAARLLLPGIDCPVRMVGTDEFAWPKRIVDEFECNRRLKVDLAFKMLNSGRSDLVTQALLLMPPTKANTFNEAGLPPLILASVRGEDLMVRVLLDAGADVDLETPANGQKHPQANSETQSWTALTFASLMGHASIVKLLLERGANVEGGAKPSEDKPTQTPLQVAVATGHLEIVTALLNYGANPFHSTLVRDTLCYMGSAQRGSFSAISVATSHGQRTILHKLLSHPLNATQAAKEVLSLEEILAEGIQHQQQKSVSGDSTKQLLQYGRSIDDSANKLLTKSQMKVLQEAMYQSAESGYLEITLDLRNLGVPWTLHTWINTLETAHDMRCETIVDQLLRDFLQILPNEDFSQSHFVDECLPLLLTIFRNGKNEGTTLLLADIFQTCYGKDPIKEIRDTCVSNNGTRIDPKYVNNPEMSDVQFHVEGKTFYAHKIVLVTASARFKQMLKGVPDSNPPLLQISDIRYPIFKLLMEYLYNGGCDTLNSSLENDDVLELMAAANFFQLDGLVRFCESKCSQMVNVESVVSLYIHAKVYNATQLLEYCQGFLLQNMVAILMHDDSVRRLIFGKKLQNHDVLAGLLITLQDRLKCNKASRSLLNCSSSSSNINSNSASKKS